MPCPACGGICTLDLLGWVAFAAVNLLGTLVLIWALFQCVIGALAPHRAIALVLLVAMSAPFVWVGTLKQLPVRAWRPRSLR